MFNETNRFEATMKMNTELEKIQKETTSAAMELAMEISNKPQSDQTDAEKKFVRSLAHVAIMSLLSSKLGGIQS